MKQSIYIRIISVTMSFIVLMSCHSYKKVVVSDFDCAKEGKKEMTVIYKKKKYYASRFYETDEGIRIIASYKKLKSRVHGMKIFVYTDSVKVLDRRGMGKADRVEFIIPYDSITRVKINEKEPGLGTFRTIGLVVVSIPAMFGIMLTAGFLGIADVGVGM